MSRRKVQNEIIIKENTAYVILTNHDVPVAIDVEDIDKIKNYCWSAKKDSATRVYARARERGTKRFTLMHRIIMGEPNGKLIDHINHDTLDNRKENLFVCTHKENNNNKIVIANQYIRKILVKGGD
jgi:hypothetical protein